MVTIELGGWWPDFNAALDDGAVKVFGTHKAAAETSRTFGWRGQTLKVDRRFESVHIVGAVDIQPESEGNIKLQVLRPPLLKSETGDDRIKRNPVLKLRRPWPG